jgi:hypothetical protein
VTVTRFTIPKSGVRADFRRTSAGAPRRAPAAIREHKQNIVKRKFYNQNATRRRLSPLAAKSSDCCSRSRRDDTLLGTAELDF